MRSGMKAQALDALAEGGDLGVAHGKWLLEVHGDAQHPRARGRRLELLGAHDVARRRAIRLAVLGDVEVKLHLVADLDLARADQQEHARLAQIADDGHAMLPVDALDRRGEAREMTGVEAPVLCFRGGVTAAQRPQSTIPARSRRPLVRARSRPALPRLPPGALGGTIQSERCPCLLRYARARASRRRWLRSSPPRARWPAGAPRAPARAANQAERTAPAPGAAPRRAAAEARAARAARAVRVTTRPATTAAGPPPAPRPSTPATGRAHRRLSFTGTTPSASTASRPSACRRSPRA